MPADPVVRFLLADLEMTAKTRPTGYLDDFLSRGQIRDGFIELSPASYAGLLAKYRPDKCRGLGDAVRLVTDWLSIPHCAGCQSRQEWLNKRFPFN